MKLPFPYFNFDIAPSNFHYAFCPDKISWDKEMKRLDLQEKWEPDYAGLCTTFYNTKKGVICIVSIPDFLEMTDFKVSNLLVHESVHVSQEFFDKIMEDRPSKEFQAYTIQKIYADLWEIVLQLKQQASEL